MIALIRGGFLRNVTTSCSRCNNNNCYSSLSNSFSNSLSTRALFKLSGITNRFISHPIRNYLHMKSTKSALVLVANGSEELETIAIVDILRRASIHTVLASVSTTESYVKCSREVKIIPDLKLEDLSESDRQDFNILVLPGGLNGCQAFSMSPLVKHLLQIYSSHSDKYIGAICAGPTTLIAAGKILPGAKLTSYPSFKGDLMNAGYHYVENDNVVIDGRLVTSKGPGTAMEFALSIVECLLGKDMRQKVASGALFSPH